VTPRPGGGTDPGDNGGGTSLRLTAATQDELVQVRARFAAALDRVVATVREDRAILAAILCGSLAHDLVWDKSDVDLVLVTIDDRAVKTQGVSIDAEGVNVHALLMSRAEFRKTVEGSPQQSFMHSFLAKGTLLYTHDASIPPLLASLRELGERDVQLQLLRAATSILPALYKARKFFITRRDLDYTAWWILAAAVPMARMEVIGRGLLADREVVPQAMALSPEVFAPVYHDLLNEPKSEAQVARALSQVDAYLEARTPRVFAPLFDYLRDAGEPRAASEIEEHFTRHLGVEGLTTACEYLSDRGLVGRASIPARLTKRSHVDVQEQAFFHIGDPPAPPSPS